MKNRYASSVLLCALIIATAACSSKDVSGTPGTRLSSGETTTISGTITFASAPSLATTLSSTISSCDEGTSLPALWGATVDLYNADRPEWLYPVAVTQAFSGVYTLQTLTHAAENGNVYKDDTPIPAGNYTIIAHKYDANTGTLYVAVQTDVKTFRGFISGNDLVAFDGGIKPAVVGIAGLQHNADGTFGGLAAVVPKNMAIQVRFNTEMARLSILSAISLRDLDDNKIEGTWKVAADLLSATFYPGSQLGVGVLYTITILGGGDPLAARNLYGDPIPETVTGSFAAASADETGPGVAVFSPQQQTNVPILTQIQIASDELLDINSISVSSEPAIGDKPAVQYAGNIGIASKPYVYTIRAGEALRFGTTYGITVRGIKDLAGNVSNPVVFDFTTAPPPAPLSLTSVVPAPHASGVALDTVISAAFSADMDASTLADPATTFTVNGVAGRVVYYAGSRTATFAPSAPLAPSTTYTAGISSAAKDITGRSLESNYTWSFTTAGEQHPGDLDPAFGSNGKRFLNIGDISALSYAVVEQPDGKIVAGGYSYSSNCPQFTLVRFNSDGSLDATFGTNGIVVTVFNSGSGSSISALALQPDGKIVAAGIAPGGFGVARYNADGSLDATFGTNGTTVVAVGSYAQCLALGLQSDGKPVMAGSVWNGGNFDVVVIRLTSAGCLDTTFNGSGMVKTDFAGGHDEAYAIAIQNDGRIVVGGHADTMKGRNFAVIRYAEDGKLDPTFGTGGKVSTVLGGSHINALGIQADGKIVAAGYKASDTNDNFWRVALVRYKTDGSLDSAFGGDGIVTTTVGNWRSEALASAIMSDGKIVIAGYSGTVDKPEDFLIARYNRNGTLDTSFGSGGTVLTDISQGEDSANALTIQSDGKIIAAGSAFVGQRTGFALSRYLP